MFDTNLKFANKLELRYVFSDRSYYMDACVLQRCDKEVLTLVRALADMFDVKLTVYHEPHDRLNGFREKWAVAGEDSRAISVVLNMFMRSMSHPTLSVGGQSMIGRTPEDEELMQKEVALLRRGLRLKDPSVAPSKQLLELLNQSPRFCKCKSNFYEALRGYPKVVKFAMRELNANDKSRSGVLEVKREQFDHFILRSDELPTIKDNRASIEIISPVLKDSKYRWKGIYGKTGETIDFYMQDEEFKKQMFDDKVSFTSGMCIDCVLEISRKLSELGEVVNVSYMVTTVIRTRFDKLETVTPQGKRHLRKLEAEKKQLTLDLFG